MAFLRLGEAVDHFPQRCPNAECMTAENSDFMIKIFSISFSILAATVFLNSLSFGWECDDGGVEFTHKPSDYYGPGEYFSSCPRETAQIRCYHYHRHWICQKGDTLYWDRNLDSAARAACNCPLPPGTAPSSPAVSKNPEKRIF
jgi:hypothetical protein